MPDKTLYTVVVADDEQELREAVCRMTPWEELGFRLVGSAGNGLDALELVERLEPDLLLTDIRMPFISGIELARQVREIRPSMHIAFLSGFDDFEYAKQAIQYNIISYMLKPLTMEGLAKELTSIREKMTAQFEAFRQQTRLQASQEGFLIPLLLDAYASPQPEEALIAQAVECGLLRDETDRPEFVVLATTFQGENGDLCTTAATVHVLDLVADKYLRNWSVYSSGKVVTLLAGNPSDFEEYLHILGSELLQVSDRVLHQRCSMGASRRTQSLAGLHNAYREAMEALSYAEPGHSDLCFISDLQPQTAIHLEGRTTLLERAEAALKSGDRAALSQCLDESVDRACADRCGRDWFDMTALQLIGDVCRIVYTTLGSEALTALQNQGTIPSFTVHYHSPTKLKEELSQFCAGAMELLSSQQKKGGSLLCQQALELIDQRYMEEDLSLASLSGSLGVSPNHLSSCIKRYAGESFINVLIQKRMEVARGLLLTTPMKVLEVAQRCGYSDQHYFSYCFKKYCGVSPNALRRQSAEREERT